ncbi:hypothetical protein [Flavobacterium sp.]|uniref:hypothetical protein n=1 Tax=Flavobacterium sp. TaxID=239 RepID=UPI002EDB6F9C
MLTKQNTRVDKILDDKKESYSKNKRFEIGQIYKGSVISSGGARVNYGFGKYIFDKTQEDYLIDSTIVTTKGITVEEVLFRPEDYDQDVIKISDFLDGLIKANGILSMGLLKKEKNYNWKCVDVIDVEKATDTSEYPTLIGNNLVFSTICETDKGHFCCAVVIDKINAAGQYEKVLKAYKLDLVNEKIIQIDLKKEKVKCLPESSCD